MGLSELQGYVAYKALLVGSMAVKVDAYKTSQGLPACGYTAEDNRPEKGLLFVCLGVPLSGAPCGPRGGPQRRAPERFLPGRTG